MARYLLGGSNWQVIGLKIGASWTKRGARHFQEERGMKLLT